MSKAFLAEIKIRNVRSLLVRILTMDKKITIRDAVRKVMSIINASHSAILDGMSPNEVTPDNAQRVTMVGMKKEWKEDAKRGPPRESDVGVGDLVKIAVPPAGGAFSKEGRRQFSEENFRVARLDYVRGGIPIFILHNLHGGELQTRFARPDLKLIRKK